MEDHSQAISFANSYFSLVDGLAPGLEDHLAENVVLDWFGRTIRGRKNVAEFVKIHKVGSRHRFNSITSVPDINCRKSQIIGKFQRPKIDNYVSTQLLKGKLNFDNLSIQNSPVDPENNNVSSKPDLNQREICNIEGNETDEMISSGYEIRENDLPNLFSLDEKKHEEKLRKGRRAFRQGNDPVRILVEPTSGMKYVEANGQIEFFKKSMKRGTEMQTWRRRSHLQISYSIVNGEDFPCEAESFENQCEEDNRGMDTMDNSTRGSVTRVHKIPGRLPSLGEITEISGNLIPNIDNFGGYFHSFDFTAERDHFLKNFNTELTGRNSTTSLRTPQYVDDRLVFPKITDKPRDIDKREGNTFLFNYLIHLIIYKGNSKCRRSLNREFEFGNKNN